MRQLKSVELKRVYDQAVLDKQEYSWNAMQSRTSRRDTRGNGPGTVREYQYDSIQRMWGSNRSSAAQGNTYASYGLDDVGNREQV